MDPQPQTRPLAGTFVALVTPFTKDEKVDESALARLVEHVIAGGVEGVVPCGTTGEKSTLADHEHQRVVERVVELAEGRASVIAGTGSNDTRHAAMMARFAREVGADAALSVVPYYNKPTQEGMVRHYCTIAERADLPLVVYNIPSRTGCKMTAETLLRLAATCPLVQAVKDATQDLAFAAEVVRGRPEGFRLLSGDDAATLALVALGGDGVISVSANEVPGRFSQMVRLALEGRFDAARKIFYELLPLMNANFLETNPIPVKAALAAMGLIEEVYRLPLCPMSSANRERLERVLHDLGLVSA